MIGTSRVLTFENSLGAPTNGMVVIGVSDLTVAGVLPGFSFLGGRLLTDALVAAVPVAVPFLPVNPGDAYTRAHELRLPITLPAMQGLAHLQFLQIDANAPMGISFSQGLRLEIGN